MKDRFSLFLSRIKYAFVGQIKIAKSTKIDPLACLDVSPDTSSPYVIEIDENTHIKAYARLGARGGLYRLD